MTNKPKAKGTAFESAVVACLQANGYPNAERRALSGVLDRGDVAGLPAVIEAKACVGWCPSQWVGELETEMANAGHDPALLSSFRKT